MMLNPIFESSARRRMRSVRTPLLITAYVGALLAVAVMLLEGFYGAGMTIDWMRRSVEAYIWMTAGQFFLILLAAPALSAGSIAGERERQTFDLLMVTQIGAWGIVSGKLMENLAFLLLLLFSGVPVMLMAWMTGGVSLGAICCTTIYLAAIAFSALTVGLFVSSLMKRSLTAILASYMAVFLIGALSWGLAKHGPLAAHYTGKTIELMADMTAGEILKGMPVTIFLNPAVGLVTLLASQTGILHRTMESTLRLYHIYTAAKAAGFASVSLICLAAMLAAAGLLLAGTVLILRAGGGRRRTKKS
ncbi:MAG: hypothetical protein J6M47_05960 [Clostridia bacterium]|nr:hypothetical protein [Clostridia bacterium]